MAIETPEVRSAQSIREGYHTITPAIVVRDAASAIDFYVRAFGATEISRAAMPNGKIMHAEIQIGDSRMMLSDEMPEMGNLGPQSLGGTASSLHISTEDVDAVFQRAVDAGAMVTMPLADQFWGDRFGMLTDPFGHNWSLATHLRDVSEEEIQAAMTQMADGCSGTGA